MYMTKGSGSSASASAGGSTPRPRCAREYGRGGLFGLLSPQSNPVAEPEIRILLPAAAAVVAARLTSSRGLLRERLLEYGERLGETVNAFGDMALDAVGVACTGSSYGINGATEQQHRTEALATQKGYPLITAAQAVEMALRHLRVRRIALVSPYPAWLTEACKGHWEGRSIEVSAVLQLSLRRSDSHRHGIYELCSSDVLDALRSFQTPGAEAIVLSGTGMPSLRVIPTLERMRKVPVLSSNLCLAWALARLTGPAAPGPESRLYGGWAGRLEAA